MTFIVAGRLSLLRLGLAFLAGHCCIHSLAALPPVGSWVLAVSAIVGLGALAGLRAPVAFLLGFGHALLAADHRLGQDLQTSLEGADLEVHGHVASLVDTDATGMQFVFDVKHADASVPPRIRLAWYRTDVRVGAGDEAHLVVRLKRRNGTANPGGFDYEGYLFREGIGATGYVRDDPRNQILRTSSSDYPLLRTRAWLAQRIDAALGPSHAAAIIKGLSVGDAQAITPAQWRVFSATGTTHLMAISGMHIGMVAMLAAWCGGLLARLRQAQRWRLTTMDGRVWAGMLAASGYSLLAGFSVPTQRTLVMLCLWFALLWRRRQGSFGHAMGIALTAVLLLDPFAPLAVGAWLSFGAVAVIVLAQAGRLRAAGAIAGFTRAQIAITIGLTPLLIVAFGSISLVSPVANAIAVPLFTLVLVPLVLAGSFAAACWLPAGAAVLGIAAQLLDTIWPFMMWLAHRPASLWHLPHLPAVETAMLWSGALLLLLPGFLMTRCLGLLLCFPIALYSPRVPEVGDFELGILDVGQGLAVVVRTREHALLYDTGPAFQSGRDAGEQVVLPYLRYHGIRRIDTMIVSHGDLDHRGGAASVSAALAVGNTLAGPSVQLANEAGRRCTRGQAWQWDGVLFEILHPGDGGHDADNDSSCVLRIVGTGGSALLTGDIESKGESALLAAGLPQTDIVIVPHHGSRSSSAAAFVSAVRARIAVFSAGYRNRWALPRADVVARWAASGAQTLVTIESGALEIGVRAGQVPEVREHREEYQRYWHR